MQNRTILVVLRPIFCEKLKIGPPPLKNSPPQTFGFPNWAEKSVLISAKTFFFFFWRPLNFGRKKPLNFGFRPKNQSQFRRRPFFFFFFWRPLDFGRKKPLNFRAFREILSQFSDKPCETDSRAMKIRVKVVCTLLTLSK